MTDGQWKAFCGYRDEVRNLCAQWSADGSLLQRLQKEAADAAKTPKYNLEIPVVYNVDYDKVTKNDEIRLIVIGDNPGKEEQLMKNSRYLVGQSGRIAEGFFRKNPELGVDFRNNVIIMNKTPVHTAKTNQLKYLARHGGESVKNLLLESQVEMARLAASLHKSLIQFAEPGSIPAELWLVGYSELKKHGIFGAYRDELHRLYQGNAEWDKVFVYQHFSMNRFIVELNKFAKEHPGANLKESLEQIGKAHRDEIFSVEKS